jgi:hypothetical protein
MALLLREALDSGAPPSMARLPMTPEEVAAAYDALDREENADGRGYGAVTVNGHHTPRVSRIGHTVTAALS